MILGDDVEAGSEVTNLAAGAGHSDTTNTSVDERIAEMSP
jgi:hypothetical protein